MGGGSRGEINRKSRGIDYQIVSGNQPVILGYSGIEVSDETDRGVKISKLLALPGITPTKLNHFLLLRYRAPGLGNPCPSHHLPPDPSTVGSVRQVDRIANTA